ncbi:MAG: hypothetical protein K6D94_11220 [Clostridiales bacterium]|nr:hypothetical protein [Clostridiales bacterium]
MDKLKTALLSLFAAVLLVSCTDGAAQPPETGTPGETVEASAAETSPAPVRLTDMRSVVNVYPELLAQPVYGVTEGEASEKPKITHYKFIKNDLVFFCGSCPSDAVIHVTGGRKEMYFRPDRSGGENDPSFWAAVYIDGGTSVLQITCERPGMSPSSPITMTVRQTHGVTLLEDHGVCGVICGDTMQGHFAGAIADYVGSNLLNDKQYDGVRKATQKKVDSASAAGAKVVYLLVPNPMNIYPETVPEEYVRSSADTSLTEQFTEIAEGCGAHVIDLTDVFLEHRYDEYNLFFKTDSHWTQYGAYFGYKALSEYLAEEFPDAAPRDVSQFRFYNKDMISGDMTTHLEIPNECIHEYATLCDLLFESPYEPNFLYPGKVEVDPSEFKDEHEVHNPDASRSLPNLVFYRDSFASCSECMFNDCGKEVKWVEMWDYSFDKSYIDEIGADYVVYLITERNIVNIMY